MLLILEGNKLISASSSFSISFQLFLIEISYFRGLATLWLLGSHVFLHCQVYIFMFWREKSPLATNEAQGFPFPCLILVFLGYWSFYLSLIRQSEWLVPSFLKLCVVWSPFPFDGYFSMAGRQVHEVPPTNIGGSPFCLAVSFRGMDIQKVSSVLLKQQTHTQIAFQKIYLVD